MPAYSIEGRQECVSSVSTRFSRHASCGSEANAQKGQISSRH